MWGNDLVQKLMSKCYFQSQFKLLTALMHLQGGSTSFVPLCTHLLIQVVRHLLRVLNKTLFLTN